MITVDEEVNNDVRDVEGQFGRDDSSVQSPAKMRFSSRAVPHFFAFTYLVIPLDFRSWKNHTLCQHNQEVAVADENGAGKS